MAAVRFFHNTLHLNTVVWHKESFIFATLVPVPTTMSKLPSSSTIPPSISMMEKMVRFRLSASSMIRGRGGFISYIILTKIAILDKVVNLKLLELFLCSMCIVKVFLS